MTDLGLQVSPSKCCFSKFGIRAIWSYALVHVIWKMRTAKTFTDVGFMFIHEFVGLLFPENECC